MLDASTQELVNRTVSAWAVSGSKSKHNARRQPDVVLRRAEEAVLNVITLEAHGKRPDDFVIEAATHGRRKRRIFRHYEIVRQRGTFVHADMPNTKQNLTERTEPARLDRDSWAKQKVLDVSVVGQR